MQPNRPIEQQPLAHENVSPAPTWEGHRWRHAAPREESAPRSTSRVAAWNRLPLPNQLFLGGGLLCLGTATLLMLGPALVEAAQTAAFPYTSEGKRQTCASNLETLGRAFALYAQDNGGALPDVQGKSGSSKARVTWVTQLRPYAQRDNSSASLWNCPLADVPTASETSAYGLNPIVAGAHSPQGETASATLLLCDRGARDDLSLLPPFPGWNNVSGSAASGSSTPPEGTTNIDFRHEGAAAGVFADGHAGMLSPSQTGALALWGGRSVLDAGVRRVEEQSAASGALVQRLREGDVAGAAKLLGDGKSLAGATRDLQALWMLNWQSGESGSDAAAIASTEIEEMGWHLARAQQLEGSMAVRTALEAQTKRRSDEEHKRVEAAGWELHTASSGVRIEVPKGWTWSEESQPRYHTAYARSPLPGLFVSTEKGDRTTFSSAVAVDWRASETRLQEKYGSGYKRLRMEKTTLLGRPAGLWEYELEKPGSPRLRKRYIGTADGWNSYVFSVTAPANCFDAWKSNLDRITDSLSLI